MRLFLIFCFLFLLMPLQGRLSVSFGPEIYQFNRIREGGTHQEGRVDGIKIIAERYVSGYGIYLGAEYLYSQGHLKGKTATAWPLNSQLSDEIYEARAGFIFQNLKSNGCPYIVPFGGWGHFSETNDFAPPSTILVRFKDSFNYITAGFLAGMNLSSLLSMGIDFKLKFMLDGTSKVSNDPIYDNITLIMEDEIQCRLDIPFTFSPCNVLCKMAMQAVPFYEFRHFGGREGFPFNFRDTKFHLYGARFSIMYGF